MITDKDRTNTDHLGDGLYVHFNGHSFELSVNDHRNPPVAHFEESHVRAFLRFVERMTPKDKQMRN